MIRNNLKITSYQNYLGLNFGKIVFLSILLSVLYTVNAQTNSPSHVNVDSLIAKLSASKVDNYSWNIEQTNDWGDLSTFLPKAKMAGITINVSILPPSKTPPICPSCNYSEPYRIDFITWAQEIAKLSLRYSNLISYKINNLQENVNLGYLKTDYINQIIAAGNLINPKIQFINIPPTYKIWYVDRDANGNGNGLSWANASKTVSGLPWASIQGGDTVYVSGGTDSTVYDRDYINGKNFSSDVIITRGWETGHNGKVYFGWIGDVIYASDRSSFVIGNSKNIKFTKLTFTTEFATGSQGMDGALEIIGSENITFDSDSIMSGGSGFCVYANGPNRNLTFTNNHIETLTNTTVDMGNDPFWIGNGYGGHTIMGNTIIQNSIYSNAHSDLIQMYHEGGHSVSDNPEFIIANNFMYMNNANNTSGQELYAVLMYSNRFLIYNNIMFGVRPISGITIYKEAGADTISLSARIFNNTIITDSANQNTFLYADTLVMKNNVFYSQAPTNKYMHIIGNNTLADVVYIDIDYNQYYRTTSLSGDDIITSKYGSGYTLTEWQALGYDTHSNTGSVSFANILGTDITDYKLLFGSSCIDTGTPISIFDTDIEGILRPQNGIWDKGAFEQ